MMKRISHKFIFASYTITRSSCRMCRREAGLDETTTLWRNGQLVFALCDRCADAHDVLMRPTPDGLKVRARSRTPLIVGGHG